MLMPRKPEPAEPSIAKIFAICLAAGAVFFVAGMAFAYHYL